MSNQAYDTSPIKRKRRTKLEMQQLRESIYDVCLANQPLTVRQAYYRLVAVHAIEKTQAAYKSICRMMVDMRRSGDMPFAWIVDNTRWMRKPTTWNSLSDMLEHSCNFYRRSIWSDQNDYLEIWCESDSVAGVLHDVTSKWDVPLMAARGFSSWSFCHSAAETIQHIGKPTCIYYFGDYDPSGLLIDRDIEKKLLECGAEFAMKRLAVTPEQIEEHSLIGRPPKKGDLRAKNFDGECVELEALPPDVLRDICESVITAHIDEETFERMQVSEDAERQTLEHVLGQIEGAA